MHAPSARVVAVALATVVAAACTASTPDPGERGGGSAPGIGGSMSGEARPSIAPPGGAHSGGASTRPAGRAPQLVPATLPATVSAASTAIVPGSVNRTSINLVATYDVRASINYGGRALSATSTMVVRNASGAGIDRLELNTVTARIGALRLGTITVDGKPTTRSIDDQTVVVNLGGVLPDGASATVRVPFRATFRNTLAGSTGSNWMFTRLNGVIEANRWIPWVSARRPFDRPNHGDPFYTASSPHVRVRISTDRHLVFATTGRKVSGTSLVQTFEATNVRDFNFAASPYYRVSSVKVGNTWIKVYGKAGYPMSTVMSYARHALARYGQLVGTYPYSTFKVAQSAGGYGMESPQLIWIPGGLSGSHLRWLVYHETAHQWFYGIVGSDQAREPFTDEAAADMMARYVTGIWRASRCSTARLDRSIYGYSAACYFEVIYIQGAKFLNGLRNRIGNTLFWTTMKRYVSAHRYGLASTKSLLDAIDAATSVNLRPTYHPRFPRLY